MCNVCGGINSVEKNPLTFLKGVEENSISNRHSLSVDSVFLLWRLQLELSLGTVLYTAVKIRF